MRKGLFRLASIALPSSGLYVWIKLRPPSPPKPIASDFILSGVTLVNPGQERREHQSIHVRRGVIEQIETERAGKGERNGASLYSGAYVLPGLIDLHTHLPPASPLKLTGYVCLLFLAHGVTSLRDAGDSDGTAVPAARKGIAAGEFPGPRVFACGPFIGGAQPRWSNNIILGAPEKADALVANLKRSGSDCIKAYEDLTVKQIRALESAAEKYGLPMLGHVPTGLGYEEALVPDTQHLLGVPEPRSLDRDHMFSRMADWQDVDSARMDLIVKTTLEHGIVNTPTLVVTQQLLLYADYRAAIQDPTVRLMPRMYREVIWNPRKGFPHYRDVSAKNLRKLSDSFVKKKELVRRLHAAGAELHLGTDSTQPFVVPGASLQQEMKLFANCGISAEEVCEIATRRAGKALGVPMLGKIQEGAPADLLVFSEDPTRSLAALKTLKAVVAQGNLYRIEDINSVIAAYQRHFNNFIFDRLSRAASRIVLGKIVKRCY